MCVRIEVRSVFSRVLWWRWWGWGPKGQSVLFRMRCRVRRSSWLGCCLLFGCRSWFGRRRLFRCSSLLAVVRGLCVIRGLNVIPDLPITIFWSFCIHPLEISLFKIPRIAASHFVHVILLSTVLHNKASHTRRRCTYVRRTMCVRIEVRSVISRVLWWRWWGWGPKGKKVTCPKRVSYIT